jgi:hypothetical protein
LPQLPQATAGQQLRGKDIDIGDWCLRFLVFMRGARPVTHIAQVHDSASISSELLLVLSHVPTASMLS